MVLTLSIWIKYIVTVINRKKIKKNEEMAKEFLVKRKSLTGLTAWLNENFKKQTNNPFTVTDVQSYVRRGYLPEYLGKNGIERDSIEDVNLYNVVKLDI